MLIMRMLSKTQKGALYNIPFSNFIVLEDGNRFKDPIPRNIHCFLRKFVFIALV